MIYIFIILAVLNGLLALAVVVLLHIDPDEVNRTSVGSAALFLMNAWFFGVAAYLV